MLIDAVLGVSLIAPYKNENINVFADISKHKLGADRKENFSATPVEADNRLKKKGPMREIEVIRTTQTNTLDFESLQGWTAYDFPGRNDKV